MESSKRRELVYLATGLGAQVLFDVPLIGGGWASGRMSLFVSVSFVQSVFCPYRISILLSVVLGFIHVFLKSPSIRLGSIKSILKSASYG